MKREYVISRIEASQDGAPYVYVAISDPNDYRQGGEKQQNPFGPNMMALTSPEDLMKNLPKAMANVSNAIGGGSPLMDSPTSAPCLVVWAVSELDNDPCGLLYEKKS